MSTPDKEEVEALIKNQFVMPLKELRKNYSFKKLTGVDHETIKSFVAFRSEGFHSSILYFNFQDEIFGFGYNGRNLNILGVTGSLFRSEKLIRPTKIELLSGKRISEMSLGAFLCAALDDSNNLYWWGQSPACPTNVRTPELAAPGHKFKAASCGCYMMAALDNDGRVYIWGRLSYSSTEFWEMRQLEIDHPVKALSVGYSHIAMVSENGQAYTWGEGQEGQRGYASYTKGDNDLVKKMDFDQECASVVCGSYNTFCLTTSGELWACGGNNMWCGCLGVENTEYTVFTPEKVVLTDRVLLMTATFNHCAQTIFAALTTKGLFWWCEGRYKVISEAPDPTVATLGSTFGTPQGHIIHVEHPNPHRLSNLGTRCRIDMSHILAKRMNNRLQELNKALSSIYERD